MTRKTARLVIPREHANRDVEEASSHYLNEGPEVAARGFIDALEQAYTRIRHRPASGSPRYGLELNLPACAPGR